VLLNLVNSTALKKPASNLLVLVRPDGFEPPTTWFEERIPSDANPWKTRYFGILVVLLNGRLSLDMPLKW